MLHDTGLPPKRLHLELTETAVIGDEVARQRAAVARARAPGVKVWLDDFGTGFSGLSHLRRVPVDGVKIDRSFVADVLRDPDDLALTTAIIAMAHSLGITVVAEGVEKEGQYAILRERGCDLAQGYWLGHPVADRGVHRAAALTRGAPSRARLSQGQQVDPARRRRGQACPTAPRTPPIAIAPATQATAISQPSRSSNASANSSSRPPNR